MTSTLSSVMIYVHLYGLFFVNLAGFVRTRDQDVITKLLFDFEAIQDEIRTFSTLN